MNQKFFKSQESFAKVIQDYCGAHSRHQTGSHIQHLKQNLNVNQLPQMVNSSVEVGLTDDAVQQNKRNYGENRYLRRKIKTFFQIFKEVMLDQTLIILMVAAIFSIVVEYFFGQDKSRFWVDGVSILVAVIICSIVGSISNYQKQKQFEDLDEMTEQTFKYDVIRNGQRKQVHRTLIVSGDIIILNIGMEVPADCIIYKAIDVVVDESAITGESVELLKNTLDKCRQGDSPIMISGSTVISGEGLMMAVIVGRNSHNGKNFEMLFSKNQQEQKTPLEQKLQDLAEKIGLMGLIAGIAIIVVLIVRIVIHDVVTGNFQLSRDIQQVTQAFIIGIVVLVAAIPEGLPLAVTLTLAFSMKQMHRQKILVRKLVSCETMGSSHYICTDKTGTITENKMKVSRLINYNGIQTVQTVQTVQKMQNLNSEYLSLLTKAICYNTSAVLKPYQKGPQTELALLKFIVDKAKVDPSEIKAKISEQNILKRLPFNSMRKRMTTKVLDEGKTYIFTSGASERILNSCSYILQENGQKNLLTQDDIAKLHSSINKISQIGYRVIGIAYKQPQGSDIRQSSNSQGSHLRGEIDPIQKSEFILLGLFGIQDNPRPQSRQSIGRALKAGIKIIMLTGDNNLTATKIAKEVGIIRDGFQKTEDGSQLIAQFEKAGLLAYDQQKKQNKSDDKEKHHVDAKLEDESVRKIKKVRFNGQQDQQKFDKIIDQLAVLSRSRPEHKYILVDALIKRGHVVAVTGDGSNDAPALKRASVGLAMGQIGTQSAKNASDIVVLDDKFDSIVRSIVWGRNVFMSIRRFLQFQLTINVFLIFATFFSATLTRQSIFSAVQILWFNLIMDSLAALALAAEPPNEEELLNHPPTSRNQTLLTPTIIKHVIGQSVFQFLFILVILFTGFYFLPEYADAFDQTIGTDLQAKYFHGIAQGTVQDGRMYYISGTPDYKIHFDKYKIYSRHLTIIFNTVVFLNVFNFFCCRKIKDELNLIQGIFSSWIFWVMIIVIVVVQILVIELIPGFFGLYKYGLTIQHWAISVGFGFTTIIVSYFLRILCIAKPPKNEYDRNQTVKS